MNNELEKVPKPDPLKNTPTGQEVLGRIYNLAAEEQTKLNPDSVADFKNTLLTNQLPTVEQTDAMIESATNIGRFTVLLQLLREFVPEVDEG
jgi:hypothetical protein